MLSCGCLSRLCRLASHHYRLFRSARHRPILCLERGWIMSKKLYVGNLNYNVDSSALEELFSAFGEVRSAQVIQDRDTGRSKGFGFVEMHDDNAAREAINSLHDTDQGGR